MAGHRFLKAALVLFLGGAAVRGDSSSETCEAEGTCPGEGPSQGDAMLQTRRIQTATEAKEEEELLEEAEEQLEASGFPARVEAELLEMQEQGGERLQAEESEEWIDLALKARVTATAGKDIAKLTDKNYANFGGGSLILVDLGMPYRITKQQIDWRVCKCILPNAARLMYSNDKKKWTVVENIKDLYVWGTMNRKLYNHAFEARYFAIQVNKSPLKYLAMYEIALYGKQIVPKMSVYGWAPSYKGGGPDDLSGTEMIHLVPYKGKLFGGTGYWKNFGKFRAAEVVRLDCKTCDWVVEAQISPYAGRTEILKQITWTTTATGQKLSRPVDKLLAGFYLNYAGEGRCSYTARNDAMGIWYSADYWKKRPFKSNYFSARALALFQDPVTKIDMLFFVTGMDGIIAGKYDPMSPTTASFPDHTESGPVETRPLALTVMDGRIYFSASSYIKRRNNGANPSWDKVFDMVDHDTDSTVDEAVGGIRGLATISHQGANVLFFAWAPNARSESCMIRLEQDGDGFKYNKEQCVKDVESKHLGPNIHKYPAQVVFSIADYNFALQVQDGHNSVCMIGFQVLLYAYSAADFPVDHSQESYSASGKRMAYFAGGGYLVRHKDASKYEARTPLGPRYDVTDVFPKQVAVRSLAASPFGDNEVYFGGYDCNHFPSQHTAWVHRATKDAAWAKPVPCQKELGCGHVPGEAFKKRGCQYWPAGATFKPYALSGWQGEKAISCQTNIDWLNTQPASTCEAAKKWDAFKRCSEIGCNFCAGTGKGLAPDAIAGKNKGGATYTCKTAGDYVKNGGVTCTQAQTWWSGVCCTST